MLPEKVLRMIATRYYTKAPLPPNTGGNKILLPQTWGLAGQINGLCVSPAVKGYVCNSEIQLTLWIDLFQE